MINLRSTQWSGILTSSKSSIYKRILNVNTTRSFQSQVLHHSVKSQFVEICNDGNIVPLKKNALISPHRFSYQQSQQRQQQQQRFLSTIPNTQSVTFKSATAPSPDSLPKPRPKARPSTSKKETKKRKGSKLKVLAYLVGVGALGYVYDSYFNANVISRTVRTVYTFATIALDYKLNFEEGKDIQALHLRTAEKVYDLMVTNKGLYIKIGQAVAVQASIFPPEFQRKFAKLFDSAPQDTWEQIRTTFVEEFGKEPDDVFEYIDHTAVASASVAQVHKARLKGTGEEVAVKIQHSDIHKQVHWDLSTYQAMMWIYEQMFEMPIFFISKYIASRMKLEINFLHELENSETTRKHVEEEWGTGDFPEVYVPRVYKDMCSNRVMVTEWIEGVSLSKKDEIRDQKFDVSKIMSTVLTLFSKQVFEWGAVHCDPHPGNIIVRKKPATVVRGPRQQVVLIDHGLYVYTSSKFRSQYSQLWQSLFLFDRQTIQSIMRSWGIGSEDLFASSVMLRPYSSESSIITYDGGNTPRELTHYELQQKMKNRFKSFIVDATHMPLELVFLGRTMGLLMGLNRMYGSPVNRVKIMAYEASKSYSFYKAAGEIPDISNDGRSSRPTTATSSPFSVLYSPVTRMSQWITAWLDYTKFRLVVAFSDLAFHFFRLGQLLTWNRERRDQKGMEDYLEKQMVGMANKMGFQVEEGQLFSG